MIHFSIQDSEEQGWLHVELNAATEMSFDVQLPGGADGYQKLFDQLCTFAPIAAKLDCQLMEALDDAGRSEVNEGSVLFSREFAQLYRFKNVCCALPGFEEMVQ